MDRVDCEIAEAAADDYSELTLLAEETLHPLAEGAGHPERFRAGELLELLERAHVFVARAEQQVIGFAASEEEPGALAVRCVCVHPAFEGRGVANQLLNWLEGFAVDRRLPRLTAYVPAGDKPSLHLYRGHAFVAIPAESPEMLVLEKRLPSVEGRET